MPCSPNLRALNLNAWTNSAPDDEYDADHMPSTPLEPLRLPPVLPAGLYRLTSFGVMVAEPNDLKVSAGVWWWWFCQCKKKRGDGASLPPSGAICWPLHLTSFGVMVADLNDLKVRTRVLW